MLQKKDNELITTFKLKLGTSVEHAKYFFVRYQIHSNLWFTKAKRSLNMAQDSNWALSEAQTHYLF